MKLISFPNFTNNLFLLIYICLLTPFSFVYSEINELSIKVIDVYSHTFTDFTQGLICSGDVIYESCGLYGTSCLKKYELKTGKLLNITSLPSNFFAEGIALQGNEIIQLTWKEKTALVYNIETFEMIKKLTYSGEGWGLCQDGEAIWMSNGTSQVVKRNPHTFEIQKTTLVTLNGQPQGFLNDLVCVGNHLYANVLGYEKILRIDKDTGEVTAVIDASNLLSPQQKSKLRAGAVFNGITYREDKQTFLVTGKFWPHIFEIVFEKN